MASRPRHHRGRHPVSSTMAAWQTQPLTQDYTPPPGPGRPRGPEARATRRGRPRPSRGLFQAGRDRADCVDAVVRRPTTTLSPWISARRWRGVEVALVVVGLLVIAGSTFAPAPVDLGSLANCSCSATPPPVAGRAGHDDRLRLITLVALVDTGSPWESSPGARPPFPDDVTRWRGTSSAPWRWASGPG